MDNLQFSYFYFDSFFSFLSNKYLKEKIRWQIFVNLKKDKAKIIRVKKRKITCHQKDRNLNNIFSRWRQGKTM